MANHASALKRARQAEKRRMINRATRTRVRNAVKSVRQALESKDAQQAQEALKQAVSIIDKAAGKGVLHSRTASRYVARLSSQVHGLGA
ncbi:MAG: 30S ribosomal protein S20 [Desulfarculus sp.]|nr:30S ribosomal protein S20 [Desulfarculus sp.]